MKTQIFLTVFFIAVAIGISSSALSQDKADMIKIGLFNREISALKSDIARLEKKLKPDYFLEIYTLQEEIYNLDSTYKSYMTAGGDAPSIEAVQALSLKIEQKNNELRFYQKKSAKAVGNDELRSQISSKKEQLANLEDQKKQTMLSFGSSDVIPREMSSCTKHRRQNSNAIRVQELVISQVENNIGVVKPSADTTTGYLVIIDNLNQLPATFCIRATYGLFRQTIHLQGETRTEIPLLPGVYSVAITLNGWQTWYKTLTIDGQVHQYLKEECFGALWMPRYTNN